MNESETQIFIPENENLRKFRVEFQKRCLRIIDVFKAVFIKQEEKLRVSQTCRSEAKRRFRKRQRRGGNALDSTVMYTKEVVVYRSGPDTNQLHRNLQTENVILHR